MPLLLLNPHMEVAHMHKLVTLGIYHIAVYKKIELVNSLSCSGHIEYKLDMKMGLTIFRWSNYMHICTKPTKFHIKSTKIYEKIII